MAAQKLSIIMATHAGQKILAFLTTWGMRRLPRPLIDFFIFLINYVADSSREAGVTVLLIR